MRQNTLLEKIQGGQILIGLGMMYPAPGIIEGMCNGWDFVWVDAQHGQITYETVLHAMRTAQAVDIESVLRVPSIERGTLGVFADVMPSAIMAPMVNNAADAKNSVAGLRFPPLGQRSYGSRRTVDLHGREYLIEHKMMLIAQIETPEGVDQAEQIIGTEGVDMLFFGPDDMKVRMNIPINAPPTEHAKLRAAMERTAQIARAAGKSSGTIASSPKMAKMAIDMGYQLLVGGNDAGFLETASAHRLAELRDLIDTEKPDRKQSNSTK